MTPEEIRTEFQSEIFRRAYWETHEKVCVNCGSREGIDIHHIVPVSRGGTNAYGNIVPVCNKCHKAIHFGKHMTQYQRTNYTGRPKKGCDEKGREAILLYLSGQITRRQAQRRMKLGKTTKLYDTAAYRDFLRGHGITKAHMFLGSFNDKHNSRGQLCDGVTVGVLHGERWEHIVRYGHSTDTVNFLEDMEVSRK